MPLSRTWDLDILPPSDIWWSSPETCSNLFTWGPTPPPPYCHLVVVTRRAVHILLEWCLVTTCKSSCGKVMFSQACVIPSVHRGCVPLVPGGVHPLGTYTSAQWSTSGRYAFYWNAFLFICVFVTASAALSDPRHHFKTLGHGDILN